MNLRQLIEDVNEKNLTKDQLEKYHSDVIYVGNLMELEIAEIEKEGALFLDSSKEPTDIAKKRKWKATEKGQREIELRRYLRVVQKLLSSLKSRLYNFY